MSEYPKPPPTRRKFNGKWDELEYLYGKCLYWFYQRGSRYKALPFAMRIEQLLGTLPRAEETARGNECLAILKEIAKDWEKAIDFRRREIAIYEEILSDESTDDFSVRDGIIIDYRPEDLADRYDLLALELLEVGKHEDALEALERSKQVCEAYGLAFDGDEIERDIRDDLAKRHSGAAP